MNTDRVRAAIYMRVSTTDGQTREPAYGVCQGRRAIVAGRSSEPTKTLASRVPRADQRAAFNQMLKDPARGRFQVLMVWSIDRLGRSALHDHPPPAWRRSRHPQGGENGGMRQR